MEFFLGAFFGYVAGVVTWAWVKPWILTKLGLGPAQPPSTPYPPPKEPFA